MHCMKIQFVPKLNYQFHAYLLFFIISNTQIGIGIFNYERTIFQAAGHDAWVSVLFAGLVTHVLVWIIIHMLEKYESADLYGIHYDLFGKWVGSLFNLMYMLYYLFVTATIIREYVEVVQAWIFPDLSTWVLVLLITLLAVYAAYGGIRVIIGMCVLGFVVIVLTSVFFYYPLRYAVWTQLLPIMETAPLKVVQGSLRMSFSLAGFELLMLLYPYIRNKKKAHLHAQISILYTNLVYIFIMIVAIIYFSPCQLRRSIWPSVNLLKIVKFSYLERIEFIVVSVWMLLAVTGILLNMWAVTRGFKRMWNMKPKITVWVVSLLAIAIAIYMESHEQIEKSGALLGKAAVVFSYVYPIVLFAIVMIVFAVRKRRQAQEKR